MKGYFLITLALLITLATAAEKYPEKYDNVDVDTILGNNRVLTNYIRCMMDEGPCTAEGRELRSKYKKKQIICIFACIFKNNKDFDFLTLIEI